MTSQPRCDEYPSWNKKAISQSERPELYAGMFLYVKNLGWLESYFLIISASALFQTVLTANMVLLSYQV